MLAIFIDSLSYAKSNVSNKKCPNMGFDFWNFYPGFHGFSTQMNFTSILFVELNQLEKSL